MSRWVPETALDYSEILGRGGWSCGYGEFALFQCPRCGQVYLIDYEVDTVFLNASDLSQRVSAAGTTFPCIRCHEALPEGRWLWNGAEPDEAVRPFAVTWEQLLASEWNWVVRREAVPAEHRS
jgi:hypothetical protein